MRREATPALTQNRGPIKNAPTIVTDFWYASTPVLRSGLPHYLYAPADQYRPDKLAQAKKIKFSLKSPFISFIRLQNA